MQRLRDDQAVALVYMVLYDLAVVDLAVALVLALLRFLDCELLKSDSVSACTRRISASARLLSMES